MEQPEVMDAMVLEQQRQSLIYKQVPIPVPTDDQVLIKIKACGICRTDLHVIDAELTSPKLPLIPGHEIIGHVVKTGSNVKDMQPGELVGVPWLGYTCGTCKFCLQGKENLCDNALFTGYTIDGGYAEYTVANARFCFKLDDKYDAPEAAPLMCAGLIGFRSYHCSATRSKISGFMVSAHRRISLPRSQRHKAKIFMLLRVMVTKNRGILP